MELLIMINACKFASAKRITAILPYFPYSKHCKRKRLRGAITAKLVANMLAVAGVHHVITMDLHNSQIQGFFQRPVDNLFAEPSIAKYIRENIPGYFNGVVVAKNAGGAKRITSLADRLNIDFALLHKDTSVIGEMLPEIRFPAQRFMSLPPSQSTGNLPQMAADALQNDLPALLHRNRGEGSSDNASVEDVQQLVRSNRGDRVTALSDEMDSSFTASPQKFGSLNALDEDEVIEGAETEDDGQLTLVGDVAGKVVFIVDDVIDSAKSFIRAANYLTICKALKVYIVGTHGILSGDAVTEFEECVNIAGVIVTNTYPISVAKLDVCQKLEVIDVSGVFAEAIRRTHNGESISYLFDTAV